MSSSAILLGQQSADEATADLEEAIQIAREAVEATPEDHPDRARHLNNLGIRLNDRFLRTGAMTDLDNAIQAARAAVEVTPEDYPDQAWYLSNLGIGLSDRYSRTGAIIDLEDAIQAARAAVEATPEDHPDYAGYLNNLGFGLGDRFLRTGAITDLEDAIQAARAAVEATPEDHPDRAMYLNNLGNRLGDRFLRTGAITDLEEAIQTARAAVEGTPKDHPDRVIQLNNLGNRLCDRFSRTGAIADLEETIQTAQAVVEATPEDHPDRAVHLNNLGFGLSSRFSRTGAIIDLEKVIQTTQAAVEATPEDHPGRAMYLNNLGFGLSKRFLRTGAMADLEEAIQITREAVEATPEDHPDRAGYLSNLGSKLSDRFLRTGAMTDLEETIQTIRAAIEATPEDHPNRANRLNNLGFGLGNRFLRTGSIIDLEESIQTTRKAVEATPEDHPDRAGRLNNLGNRLGDRFLRTGAMTDLEEAVSCHRSALHQLTAGPVFRIAAGRQMLRFTMEIKNWQAAYEVSEFTISLIPQLISRSLENSDKQHFLSEVAGFACDAASIALHAGKKPVVALNLLEMGRGMLAASLEDIRVDILDLREKYPCLAERFDNLRDELQRPFARNATANASLGSNWKDQVRLRSKASDKLDELIDEIRQNPEFKDFLLPPSEVEMQAAANFGPIVVVNVSKYRCDAILVEHHQIRILALPNLSSEKLEQKAERDNLGTPGILEWLWDVVTGPILEALGFIESPTDDDWPHVWWIPTGVLSKFPLHAAGRYAKSSSEKVLDRIMSSYSSSVKALIHSRRRRIPPSTSSQALLVAMPDTPGSTPLPSAAEEVTMLRDLCKSMVFDPIEPGRRKSDIISHLPQCKIFHFAGHGYTDSIDPSKSHLLLTDGKNDPLTVANLLEMNIRQHSPFLAYLSACGTGQIRDEKFLDESIHLISAFQLAGFRHVIGTLWEVNDELCVDMARITYKGMRDGGMTDESVCRGLHNASRELRNRWLSIQSSRRGRRWIRRVGANLDHKPGARDASHRNQGDGRSPRDAVIYDDDDNEEGSLHWVPYVHFGV